MTGLDGLLKQLTKTVLETALSKGLHLAQRDVRRWPPSARPSADGAIGRAAGTAPGCPTRQSDSDSCVETWLDRVGDAGRAMRLLAPTASVSRRFQVG